MNFLFLLALIQQAFIDSLFFASYCDTKMNETLDLLSTNWQKDRCINNYNIIRNIILLIME